jgi:hypothetical protein
MERLQNLRLATLAVTLVVFALLGCGRTAPPQTSGLSEAHARLSGLAREQRKRLHLNQYYLDRHIHAGHLGVAVFAVKSIVHPGSLRIENCSINFVNTMWRKGCSEVFVSFIRAKKPHPSRELKGIYNFQKQISVPLDLDGSDSGSTIYQGAMPQVEPATNPGLGIRSVDPTRISWAFLAPSEAASKQKYLFCEDLYSHGKWMGSLVAMEKG